MQKRRRLGKVGLRALWLLGGAASCSVLYDLNQVQCEIREDCTGFDEHARCVDGICVQPTDITTSSGGSTTTAGGSGGSGNSTSGGTDTTATTTTGGGAAGAPGCQNNTECIDENRGNPAICRSGDCVPLESAECPVVLGQGANMAYIKSPAPIIFGAYSFIDPTVPADSAPTANYALAINEINEASGNGLLVNGVRRPFVGIVCDAYGDIDASMEHLIDAVGVPAIISSLYTRDLLGAFEAHGKKKNVFFLSPLEADSTLTDSEVDPDGLMWHLLPPAVDLAGAYKPLLERTEALIRTQQSMPTEEAIRVAMVVAQTPFLLDIADEVSSSSGILFNGGKTAGLNEQDENFQRIEVASIIDNSAPNLGAAWEALVAFEPHVVLAIASGEFMFEGMIYDLENAWEVAVPAQPPPFYLLSPYVYGLNSTLNRATQFENIPPIPLRQRMLGVNFAAAADSTLYDAYLSRLKSANTLATFVLDGTENFYDAAYFLMYAIAGSGIPNNLRGNHVAAGMNRLIGGSSAYQGEPGRTKVSNIVSFLRSSADSVIQLNGTLGPPTFNAATGARRGLPSVYCIDESTDGTMAYEADVLTYDPESITLMGDQPCSIEGFWD